MFDTNDSTLPEKKSLRVRGARANNLQDVSIDLPHDSLVVFTGVSGSGKSSLAFDTIFAEGQRRYVESLSSYARMFLDQVGRPDVESIEGLRPAVSMDQKSTNNNPRSTVGTITEVHDYLRLLWSRLGVPHCSICGEPIRRQTVLQIADQVASLSFAARAQILSPVVVGMKGSHVALLQDLMASGFSRVVIDGEMVRLSDSPSLDGRRAQDISVVVDRVALAEEMLGRITEAVEVAVGLSGGTVVIDLVDDHSDAGTRVFSEDWACPSQHPVSLTSTEPRMFSFNAPYGACPSCSGLGVKLTADPHMLIGDEDLSLNEGVLLPWAQSGSGQARYFANIVEALARDIGFSMSVPWSALPEEARTAILQGSSREIHVDRRTRSGRDFGYRTQFEGIIAYVERKHAEADTPLQQRRWSRYLREIDCVACGGARLRPEVLAVLLRGKNIAEVSAMSLSECASFLDDLVLDGNEQAVGHQILQEIRTRLQFLLDVGLDYLSLSRTAGTLSGGEAQRIRLATQVGAGLTGVLYVLDEPSIGLHQRDNDQLIGTLERLRDLGNTVLVVEHDEDTIRAADWIVDIGPDAGENGGELLYSGPADGLLLADRSVTASYLNRTRTIPLPAARRARDAAQTLRIVGARANNLRDIDVEIPLGVFTAVTGVSGSGKSTLINDVLSAGLANALNGAQRAVGRHRRIEGIENLAKIVHVDQSPIGRTPRSNPATYTGVFDRIRSLFAETPDAKAHGYTAGRFSFNVKGGRCEDCAGDGTVRIEMNFLPDVFVDCETCEGARYNRDTLLVRYKGKTIADVLDMTIRESVEFFGAFSIISRYLRALDDIGLGYMRLGQSATTLSGGEAQRVKLATELQRQSRGKAIYILDEPTTGLHFDDVNRLLTMLQALTDQGHTVVTIEHNLDVVKSVDWVIDMGPEGGVGGGLVVSEGTPETVASHPSSWTGKYLARMLTPGAASAAAS